MNLLPQLPPDVQAFLFALATTPGVFFSQLEAWQWFASLTVWQKLGFQVVVSGLAAALLTLLAAPALPAGTLDHVNGGYLVIVQIITAIAANFGGHLVVNKIVKPAGNLIEANATKTGPQG